MAYYFLGVLSFAWRLAELWVILLLLVDVKWKVHQYFSLLCLSLSLYIYTYF